MQPSMNLLDIWYSLTFSYSYNASIVCLALIFQGLISGIIGGLLLHRRKALLTDTLSHATLPGVGIGFLISLFFMDGAREEWVILGGALFTVVLALGVMRLLERWMRQDAALSLTLSGFYGGGVVLLSYIQTIPSGTKAGLEYFLLGQSATINLAETTLISSGALVVFVAYFALYKEWKLLCFDQKYAAALGYNINLLDLLLTILACITIAVGIRSMGLILIMGIITIPALTASLLVKNWSAFILTSALIGAISAHIGVSISAGLDDVPSGSAIILFGMLFYFTALIWRTLHDRYGNLWARHETRQDN